MMATTTRGGGAAGTCNDDDSTSANQKQTAFAFMDEKYYSTDMAQKNDPDINTTQQRLYFGRPLIESIALGSISLVIASSFVSICHTHNIVCICIADAYIIWPNKLFLYGMVFCIGSIVTYTNGNHSYYKPQRLLCAYIVVFDPRI